MIHFIHFIGVAAAVVLGDYLLTTFTARRNGISTWRMWVIENGVFGTMFLRGPLAAYEERQAKITAAREAAGE